MLVRIRKWEFATVHTKSIKGMKPEVQTTYVWLCHYACSEEWTCFPSVGTIAENAGISERTAQRSIAKLKAAWLVEIATRFIDGRQTSNEYKIFAKQEDEDGGGGCHTDGGEGVTLTGVINRTNPEGRKKVQKKDWTQEYESFITESESVTSKVLERMISLGFKPSESVEDFRNWLKKLIELNGIQPQELDKISSEWHLYWSASWKAIKNHKTSLMNCPSFPNNQKKWNRTQSSPTRK